MNDVDQTMTDGPRGTASEPVATKALCTFWLAGWCFGPHPGGTDEPPR